MEFNRVQIQETVQRKLRNKNTLICWKVENKQISMGIHHSMNN